MGFTVTALFTATLMQNPGAAVVTEGQPVPMAMVDGRACLADDDVCLAVVEDAERGPGAYRVALSTRGKSADEAKSQPLPCLVGEDQTPAIWPYALPVPGDGVAGDGAMKLYLVGVLLKQSVGYSGGGADVSRLCLSSLGVGRITALGTELANLPWRSLLMIRACFDDADRNKRRGVCHDEYDYSASLMLAPDGDGGVPPALVYRTEATAYPQTARRWEDSSAASPLTPSDLSHWRDPECSYGRTLRFNPATDRYEMDRPAPDCQAYTAP